jgi:hypothetical protein
MGKGKNNEEQMDISQDMKSKVQPSQDNCDPMVKKLEKSETMTCYKCHGEGTSRDVVINDVTLMSMKTPEWSQLVFCDDFVLVTMVASHLFIGDEIGFFVIYLSPICGEFCVVMDLKSFYDERFWSYIIPCFRHNFTSAWLRDVAVNAVSDFVTIRFRHNLPSAWLMDGDVTVV